MPSLQEIRIAIREALPREPSAEAADLRPGIVYFPPSHVKALQLESSLCSRWARCRQNLFGHGFWVILHCVMD